MMMMKTFMLFSVLSNFGVEYVSRAPQSNIHLGTFLK